MDKNSVFQTMKAIGNCFVTTYLGSLLMSSLQLDACQVSISTSAQPIRLSIQSFDHLEPEQQLVLYGPQSLIPPTNSGSSVPLHQSLEKRTEKKTEVGIEPTNRKGNTAFRLLGKTSQAKPALLNQAARLNILPQIESASFKDRSTTPLPRPFDCPLDRASHRRVTSLPSVNITPPHKIQNRDVFDLVSTAATVELQMKRPNYLELQTGENSFHRYTQRATNSRIPYTYEFLLFVGLMAGYLVMKHSKFGKSKVKKRVRTKRQSRDRNPREPYEYSRSYYTQSSRIW